MKNSFSHIFKWQYALVVLLVTAASVFTFSAPVRAKALELIRIVAGFNVEERNEDPLKNLDEGEIPSSQAAALISSSPTIAAASEPTVMEPTVYSVPTFTLPEALENPPFQFGLPAWVPEGYVLDQNVGVTKSWVSMDWNNSNKSEIEMLVEQEYTGYNLPAGEGSSEEIKINGQSALLIRGFWHDGQWDPRRGIMIGWVKEGHFYRLNYYEREPSHNEIKPIEGDMEVIIKELIRMAESVR